MKPLMAFRAITTKAWFYSPLFVLSTKVDQSEIQIDLGQLWKPLIAFLALSTEVDKFEL
jgi:hypothetical protein